MDQESAGRTLEPLPYHRSVVDYLKQHEPEVWAWAGSQQAQQAHLAQVRTHLLRDTYRLEAEAHPDVHARLALAMQRLGIQAGATLYQAGGQAMNAALVHVPGEVHIVLEGPVLERLSEDEWLALFGHELAHYLLWSCEGGAFFFADRILQDALGSPQASDSHRQTAQCYGLHTELFADRGAALAADALEPAVSTLVKVHTGIGNPDPAAYLRQAIELEGTLEDRRAGSTHPETFVRARALDLWWQGDASLDAWTDRKLRGELSLATLDLPRQVQVQAMTRAFLDWFLDDPHLRSDAVMTQARLLFADWAPGESGMPAHAWETLHADDDIRVYFNALMLDLALADPDVRELALQRALVVSQVLDSQDLLLTQLKRDAGLGKREIDRLRRKATAQVHA